MPTKHDLITVAACVVAFVVGIVGVTAWSMWDVSKRIR